MLIQRLKQIYGADYPLLKEVQQRYEKMITIFQSNFPNKEYHIFRAPGRINIIGEHTDYNGLPVLPMTIDLDMVLVAAPRQDSKVIIRNTNPVLGDREFVIEPQIPPYPVGDWGNYVKASSQSIQDYVGEKKLFGFEGVMDGIIPASAGLSSSSALVVMIGSALTYFNELKIERLQLAEIMAQGERYVGTEGGGMDQAISLLGGQGKALKIDFFPLQIEPVPLPKDYVFVVCNSLVVASKSGGAQQAYNRRVAECRLGATILSRHLQEKSGDDYKISKLGDLRDKKFVPLRKEIPEIIETMFEKDVYTLDEIAKSTNLEVAKIRETCLKTRVGGYVEVPTDGFKLKSRCRHEITEWYRVEETRNAFLKNDIEYVGKLLNDSHESLAKDYEVSCPELDRLVKLACENGAIGSRLTGAGFGGCTISLVPKTDTDRFVNKIIDKYYKGKKDKNIFVVRSTEQAGIVI